jgi:hypothetical protein
MQPRILACPGSSRDHRSPSPFLARSHSLLESTPSRVPRVLLTVQPVGRIRLPEVSRPSNGTPVLAPQEAGRHARLGSALRFAPPPSGFLAGSRLAAFFHAARRSWALLLQSLPCRQARTPLGARCSLAVIHRRAWTRRSGPCHRPFHRRPRSRAVAWIPGRLRGSFPCPGRHLRAALASAFQCALPGPSRPRATEPSRSARFTRFGAFFLPAGRAPPSGSPPTSAPLLSWSCSPLELSPSTPRSLDPSQGAPGCAPCSLGPWLAVRLGPAIIARGPGGTTSRTSRPSEPGEAARARVPGQPRRRLPAHYRLARTASRRCSFSLGLGEPGAPGLLAFEASKYVESCASPQRSLALLGFLASSSAPRLRSPRRSGLSVHRRVGLPFPVARFILGPSGAPPAALREHLSDRISA